MKNLWITPVLFWSGDHGLCKAHCVCCPSGAPRLRKRTSSRRQLAHCDEDWGGSAHKRASEKEFKGSFSHKCISTWLAALLERLRWGRALHARPGPAELHRPADSKVGPRFGHKHARVCVFVFILMVFILPPRQFCAQPGHAHGVFCRHLSEGRTEASWRVIEGSRRRMVVDARLENKGENAYSARLNITYTPNLRFSSLNVKVGCWPCLKTNKWSPRWA